VTAAIQPCWQLWLLKQLPASTALLLLPLLLL
jgi:hypothetical protein